MDSTIIRIGIFILALIINACRQEDICLQPQTISMNVKCYRLTSAQTLVDTVLPNVTIGIPNDTFTYFKNTKNNVQFALTLSPLQDSSSFYIQPDSANSNKDTFILHYKRKLTFISNACGYQQHYTLYSNTTTLHTLHSIQITTPEVTNDVNKIHIKLIF